MLGEHFDSTVVFADPYTAGMSGLLSCLAKSMEGSLAAQHGRRGNGRIPRWMPADIIDTAEAVQPLVPSAAGDKLWHLFCFSHRISPAGDLGTPVPCHALTGLARK